MMTQNIEVILNEIYPMIEKKLIKNENKLKQCVGRFFEKRNKELYDTCPCSRISFTQDDLDDFYKTMEINEKEITEKLSKTYYYSVPKFNPKAAKDEFTIAVLCIIRHFYFISNKKKETEMMTMYLAFSGKFYPSIHYGSYPKFQPSEHRYVMEYVVNEMLTNKFDIKTTGTVFGAIKNRCNTWLDTYSTRFKEFNDEDIAYLIQQLHDRIKAFMKNIAELYYEAYEKKDVHLVYDSDNLDDDNYRLADNNSLKIERFVEKTMTYVNGKSVDWRLCKMCSDSNVKTDEIKNIIESIFNDRDNIILAKELIRLIITIFMNENKNKDVTDISFISKSITPKPNSKDPYVLRQREIVEDFLTNNSTAYNRRKNRNSTRSSYQKAITSYFVLLIHEANRK